MKKKLISFNFFDENYVFRVKFYDIWLGGDMKHPVYNFQVSLTFFPEVMRRHYPHDSLLSVRNGA